MGYNPWKVASIQAFSCLKCPQCAFYTKEGNYFERHAMSNHPLSYVLFGKFEDDNFEVSNPDEISKLSSSNFPKSTEDKGWFDIA